LPYLLLVTSGIVLLILEFSIAVSFATNWMPGYREIAVMLILTLFTVLSALKQKKGDGECACFGNLTIMNRFPLFRNGLFLFLLVIKLLLPERVAELYEILFVVTTVIVFSIMLDTFIYYKRLREFGAAS
jgi:hypothetical protein